MADGFTRSAGDVLAEIAMSRTVFSGAYVLVEGPSDSRFWTPRVQIRSVQIIICGGKDVVVAAMQTVCNTRLATAIGLVDDDYDRFVQGPINRTNVVITDSHDMETMLCDSPAFDKILAEYCDPQKIDQFQQAEGRPVRASLIARALPFGRLRLLNARNNLGVDFGKDFSPWKYVREVDWEVDEIRLFGDFATKAGLTADDLAVLLATAPRAPEWSLVSGHDALQVLSIGLRRVLGGVHVPAQKLCAALRLAYEKADLCATQLYGHLCAWERANGIAILS